MSSRDRSFYFTATPPTGTTPQKPLHSGDAKDETSSCGSFTPDSISRRRRHGEYLHRPAVYVSSSISRTLSSATTRSSETHLAQTCHRDTQQSVEAPNREQNDMQPRPFDIATEREGFSVPEVQAPVHESPLTLENLEKLNLAAPDNKHSQEVALPSPSAQATDGSANVGPVQLSHEDVAHYQPHGKDRTRLRYCKDIRCTPRTSWAFKEGSLVIGIDPTYVHTSPNQARFGRDIHGLEQGKNYVICRMYTDLWALCIEVSLDGSSALVSQPPLGAKVGFLPLCAVTLPVNYASFLRRCDAWRDSPDTHPLYPGNGQCVSAPPRHTSLEASSRLLNLQQSKQSLGMPVPRMVHEVYGNFLFPFGHNGDLVVAGPSFSDRLPDKPRWLTKALGHWRVKTPKKPQIQSKHPDPITEKLESPTDSDSTTSLPQLLLYRRSAVSDQKTGLLRRLIRWTFRC